MRASDPMILGSVVMLESVPEHIKHDRPAGVEWLTLNQRLRSSRHPTLVSYPVFLRFHISFRVGVCALLCC